MKIVLIGPVYPYRGGIAHYTTSLALALQKAGHEVHVISFKRQYPAFLYPGQSDKDPSENAVRVNAKYLLDPLYPWTWLHTAREIRAIHPDLVLIQWWVTFWGLAFGTLAHLLGNDISIAYLIHNVLPHESRIWDKMLARFGLGSAAGFIVQSASQQQRLIDLLPKARIRFCHHPVYGRFGKQTVSKVEARKRLAIPVTDPVFLFFGIVRPYKGLKFLIDALAKTVSSIHLVVAGEFWENVNLYEEQINTLGLNGRVTLINKYIPNEEAHIIFSSADALVAPYIGGTQSGVAELALGYQLPVIITDRIAAGVTDTDIPLKIVPSGDVNALASAMNVFVKNTFQPTAHESVAGSWERMVKTIEGMNFENL